MVLSARHKTSLILGTVLLLGLSGGLIVWPNYSEAASVNREVRTLQEKAASYSDGTSVLKDLAEEVMLAEQLINSELRAIPEAPDVADLMRRLALPMDGTTVVDQTFSADEPRSALTPDEAEVQAMPLRIEMRGRFDSVFALLRLAESMDRLVRVRSVRLTRPEDGDETFDLNGAPQLDASLELEALFEPVETEELTP